MKTIQTHLLLFLSLSSPWLFANNLTIQNFTITNHNTTELSVDIEFDISWENGWKDGTNWDAAWVFVKYKKNEDSRPYQHVNLSENEHFFPENSSFILPEDRKGVFIYRKEIGTGNTSFSNVRLHWNYGDEGIENTNNINFKIFGIEMVYVPQGSFYLGDGQIIANELYGNFERGNTGEVFQVTSENSLTLGGSGEESLGNNNGINQYASTMSCSGCLNGSGDDFNDNTSQTLPSDFPKGYNAFYCMKYEMSQQQFVDMLNCLTTEQQTTYLTSTNTFYYSGSLTDNRYSIQIQGDYYTTSDPYAPMIFFDWIKSAAYADWAALRPMTELEFEKACRGFELPVTNEYAWGNAQVDISNNLTLANIGEPNESISSGYDSSGLSGNSIMRAGSQFIQHVARVGIFAAHSSNTGRVSSGATLWGIMEMSGNAWERAVSVGHTEGRKFTGIDGDGALTNYGYANVTNWPGTLDNNIVQSNLGVGYRGGALAFPTPNLQRNGRVSSRRLASGYWNTVINDDGVRFVRSVN